MGDPRIRPRHGQGRPQAVCPLAYATFERHMVNGAHFSGDELDALKQMLAGEATPLEGRRLAEFEQKLNK